MALACSITAKLSKIEDDVLKILKQPESIRILIFATPRKVQKKEATDWANAVRKTYDIDLYCVSREDIITDLMLPGNASICRNHLGIHIPEEPSVDELRNNSLQAAAEIVVAWLAHPRRSGKPRLALQAKRLDNDGKETGDILDLSALETAILVGKRIVLEGPAGQGKTTTLIQLAERLYCRGEVAFLVDLPTWLASGGIDLLQFLASIRSFRSRRIGAEDLARLCGAVQCSFLLNGWNEVSEKHSDEAVRALTHLEREFPTSGIIVATRTHHIRPPLPGSFRARILALDRSQRIEYLQQALAERAGELVTLIEGDRVLDNLTRTPLILAEIASIFKSGVPIPRTKVGILDAAMKMVEFSEEHRDHLQRLPIMGHSRDYLVELGNEMTTQGDVTVVETRARSIVHSVCRRLNKNGQIATIQEPAEILAELCAHHILERIEHPIAGFKFQHQQFQEFFSATKLRSDLWGLNGRSDQGKDQWFAREYLNRPVWEEPLRMLAEEFGELSQGPTDKSNAVAAGKHLIELVLDLDPVFAADLSRLCGAVVWREVRGEVEKRMRSWYGVADEHHRMCALSGMIASGSEAFIDIVLPLLSSHDQQVRLSAFRAWGQFFVSILGKEWRQIVGSWPEEQRVDFIGEVVRERGMAAIAEDFALSDPTPKVRAVALRVLEWVDASDALTRVLKTFDEGAFEDVLRDGIMDSFPAVVQLRANTTYENLLRQTKDRLKRLQIRLAKLEVGGELSSAEVKEELDGWPSGKGSEDSQRLLKSAMTLLRKTDPQWVSHWVAKRIVDDSLLSEDWISLVTCVPGALRQELLEKIGGEIVGFPNTKQIVSVLAATADADFAGLVFSRLCDIRRILSNTGVEGDTASSEICRQLEDLFRALPTKFAVEGILRHCSTPFDPVQFCVVIEIFGRIDESSSDLRAQMQDDLCQSLRNFLLGGVTFALGQEDNHGKLKANLALAVARVGNPEDMIVLHRLIQSDIERLRKGREARLKSKQGPFSNGARMVWSHWHVKAVVWLNPGRAEEVLLEVLNDPEYEHDAAKALLSLARNQNHERPFGFKTPDYRSVWVARNGLRVSNFNENLGSRYADAIRKKISTVMEERQQSQKPDSFNSRLKGLASTFAVLCDRESAEFVMEIMALPGEWDGWTRVNTIELLLFNGAKLNAEPALKVLNPTIDHIRNKVSHDQQAIYLLRRCLCLLPFLDPPSVGINRIREIVTSIPLSPWELREVIISLGHSRCNEALSFLLDLARAGGRGLQDMSKEWIDAVAQIDTQESNQVLLSFVDPDIKPFGVEHRFSSYDRECLASHIAHKARSNPEIRNRIFLLCAMGRPLAARLLLAGVISEIGDRDAVSVGLDLIDDESNPSVPYDLVRGMEKVFLERRPYDETGVTFSLEPKCSSEMRSRLFCMLLGDPKRRRSAWALLGQIEWWRLEYGRPRNEVRHPAIESGELWPPLERLKQLGIFYPSREMLLPSKSTLSQDGN
ncbi:MAG: ATP-binding protein [Candidatus Ozemobacteraceae bacterium]